MKVSPPENVHADLNCDLLKNLIFTPLPPLGSSNTFRRRNVYIERERTEKGWWKLIKIQEITIKREREKELH